MLDLMQFTCNLEAVGEKEQSVSDCCEGEGQEFEIWETDLSVQVLG